jgi:hypothetical protein
LFDGIIGFRLNHPGKHTGLLLCSHNLALLLWMNWAAVTPGSRVL